MPAKKKATTRASARSAGSRAKPATRRTTSRKPVLRRRSTTKPDALEPLELTSAEDEPVESGPVVLGQDASEPATDVAVVAEGLGSPPETAEGIVVPPGETESEPGVTDRFPEDIPVMIASAVLAASVFLPWYKIKLTTGTAPTANGWETGTWGPMIFFLGLASLVLGLLRRRGVRVSLPVPDSYVHEGAGWLSLIGAIIKLRLAPKAGGGLFQMGSQPVMMIPTIASAFVLAFLAGRMSGSIPLVAIPGWFRGKSGKIGLALLLVAIGGAAAFGTLNNVDVEQLATGRPPTNNQGANQPKPDVITGRFPNCAKTFPKPTDAKPLQGLEPRGNNGCVFIFSSKQTVDQLVAFYKAQLPKAGFTFNEVPGNAFGKTISITKPTCGSMTFQRQEGAKETTVTALIGNACPSPSARQSGRPSSGQPSGPAFAPGGGSPSPSN